MATLNYVRHIPKHFGVCSSGFSLLPARFEAIMRIAGQTFSWFADEALYFTKPLAVPGFKRAQRGVFARASLMLKYILVHIYLF